MRNFQCSEKWPKKICPKIFSQEKVEWKAPVSGHQMVRIFFRPFFSSIIMIFHSHFSHSTNGNKKRLFKTRSLAILIEGVRLWKRNYRQHVLRGPKKPKIIDRPVFSHYCRSAMAWAFISSAKDSSSTFSAIKYSCCPYRLPTRPPIASNLKFHETIIFTIASCSFSSFSTNVSGLF